MAARQKLPLYKVVLLGVCGVGKTALCARFCLDDFLDTYQPTLEDSYRRSVKIDTKQCMVEMTDTTGEEDYSALREQWIHDGQGFLVVYSITSRYSFEAAQRLYKQVQEIKGPSNPPVILVGNKFDESSTAREVSIAEGAALADELGCEFMEASAKVDINVHLAFANIVRALRRGAMEYRQKQLEMEKARLERLRAEIELRKREERAARKSGGEVIHDEHGMPRNKNAFSRFIGKLKG